MQIQNVTLAQNNYSQKSNPNFTAIKSVKCQGLYKKYPELANNLVNAFQKNPFAMEFCKKYDVNIVFHAMKQFQDGVESSIHIFFDNVSKSKTRKFFDKLLSNNEDKVVIHAWGNEYSIPRSIEQSTANLVESISPQRKVADGYRGGMLDSHLRLADDNMQKVVNEKSKKILEKEAKHAVVKDAKHKLNNANTNLQNSIDDLIKKGS